VLVTGLLRWFVFDVKGAAFFNTNPLFHIKVTIFVIIAVISIFPTLKILRWNRQVKREENVEIPEKEVKKNLMLIRIQLFLLVMLPLLAVMVANGVRM
jgi:putative membrane protein